MNLTTLLGLRERRALRRAGALAKGIALVGEGGATGEPLCQRLEPFLLRLFALRWYDVHLFIAAVEPDEALRLTAEPVRAGSVFAFLCERQDDAELENAILAGWCLASATRMHARKMGFDPAICGEFTLQRMLDQVIESCADPDDLIAAARGTE
jgi:hypothetical protein